MVGQNNDGDLLSSSFHMASNSVRARITDLECGSRNLLFYHPQLPYLQPFEVRICEQEQDDITNLRDSIGFVFWRGDE